MVLRMYKNKNINNQSSTSNELVGVNDTLPHIIQKLYFIKSQGYEYKAHMYKDNKTAILLERNRNEYLRKCNNTTNIWYFFIKDHIDCGDVELKNSPIKNIMANPFTKLLQGQKPTI